MQIMLAEDVEAFVAEQVRSGASPSAADLVNGALRAWSLQCQRPFDASGELEAWLLKAADASTAPVTPEDFAGIRERVRTRLAGASS